MTSGTQKASPKVDVIGGGPAGLMAAEVLSQAGATVTLYDAMPSVGRKFLIAGIGGMNISNAEPFTQFVSRYGTRQTEIEAILKQFDPNALREWVHGLGFNTFVGSSGRIFPTDMKAAPLLRAWLHRLRTAGVNLQVRHHWQGWSPTNPNALIFNTPSGAVEIETDAVILALGGGSWAKLGSTGAWVSILAARGIAIAPLLPSNCGFESNWSEHFSNRFAGQPLKSIAASCQNMAGNWIQQQGELIITATGIEGGLSYALSALLRDTILATGSVTLRLDLMPNFTIAQLTQKLSVPKGKQSLANYLRKRLGLDGLKTALLREMLTLKDFDEPTHLAALIKALPLKLLAARPLDEAISSAGGVKFEELDTQLMLNKLPGVFCTGEMLDWEAPTGGYLLSACLASGRVAGQGTLNWLQGHTNKNECL